jgi:hypothetical protein
MFDVQPGQGERRDRSDRRVSGRRSGKDRRTWQRRMQFICVAVELRAGTERRTMDRRRGVGRRISGNRRGARVGD